MDKDPRMYAHGPYKYITKHGIGPGTLPKDVNLVKWEDLDNYYTAIWTDRFLTTQELKDYDIYPESIQNIEDIPGFARKKNVFESLTNEDVDKLSELSLTETETNYILNLLELVSDDNKDKALGLVDAIFKGKKLVQDVAELRKPRVSESYTRRLLGDI